MDKMTYSLATTSDVVQLTINNKGIAVFKMSDEVNRNTFSKNLIRGIKEAFQIINQHPAIKVVIVEGLDRYFCCGGTKEELLAIYEQKFTFTDLDFYRVFLDCPVPVIAAMKGHTLGGGLAFACFADILLLAEESIYSTNFMKYGFTPGMGATYIVSKKFGEVLGHEMLYTAHYYKGKLLKERNVPITVVKQQDISKTATEIAASLIEKPRLSLITLKAHLSSKTKEELPKFIEKELAMHKITLAQPEVKKMIEELY